MRYLKAVLGGVAYVLSGLLVITTVVGAGVTCAAVIFLMIRSLAYVLVLFWRWLV